MPQVRRIVDHFLELGHQARHDVASEIADRFERSPCPRNPWSCKVAPAASREATLDVHTSRIGDR
jgi:hypothetical protein